MKKVTGPSSMAYLSGVNIHPAWKEDFDAWLVNIGTALSAKYRFVRIDKRLGFVPNNCTSGTIRSERFGSRS